MRWVYAVARLAGAQTVQAWEMAAVGWAWEVWREAEWSFH